MEATGSFKIRFEDLTAADGNRAAAELQSMIEDSGIDAELVKDRQDKETGHTWTCRRGPFAWVWNI